VICEGQFLSAWQPLILMRRDGQVATKTVGAIAMIGGSSAKAAAVTRSTLRLLSNINADFSEGSIAPVHAIYYYADAQIRNNN